MATIKDVARAAGVSTATVSAVVNDSAYVSPQLRARVLTADRASFAMRRRWWRATCSSGRTQLIALAVADLANPFYRAHRQGGGGGGRGLGLLAGRVQQRREAGHRKAHPVAHPNSGLRRRHAGAGRGGQPVSPPRLRGRHADRAARPLDRRRPARYGDDRQPVGRQAGDELSARSRPYAASARSPARCR